MTNNDTDFDTWFDILSMNLLDRCGVDFNDRDAVRDDFDRGRDVFDVIDEIAAEYAID